MIPYVRRKKVEAFPRIPLEGYLDLTYRCNNDCLHCWVRIAPGSDEKGTELTIDEIGRIADEARALGCRKWILSGGEPMLRPDFAGILELLTSKSSDYILNTNGTLITPKIARLLKRKGAVLVALYGADARVHDAVTRRPGSFEETMRGIAYLKEADAEFIAQIVPMRANFHQFEAMKRLALSLTPRWRVGAAWLFMSASGDPAKNAEIAAQRLSPSEALAIEPPEWPRDAGPKAADSDAGAADAVLDACLRDSSSFHVDPYGRMSFCEFIKDAPHRVDLRRTDLRRAWEETLPSLAGRARGGREYAENCGRCPSRSDCGWCPAFAHLEHRRFSAPVDALCRLAAEKRRFSEDRAKTCRRFYQVAGLTIQVEADLPIEDRTFDPTLRQFETSAPGDDRVVFRHHFGLPPLIGRELGTKVYEAGAWSVFRKGRSWIYIESPETGNLSRAQKVAVASGDHLRIELYHATDEAFRRGGLSALSLLATDQILLGRVLAERRACYLHACGIAFEGAGLLFVGESTAGKSTVAKMFGGRGTLLCDDRIALRRGPDGFRIYGTWHGGEIQEVNALSAPLTGLFFLEKADDIKILPVRDKAAIVRRLAPRLIKPLATADWWEKSLDLLETVAEEAACYDLRFDRSGRLVDEIKALIGSKP